MSFRINTNGSAMFAARNLGIASDAFQKSVTKLSTGLRINNAGDDPAGLVGSEQMRAQVGGIAQGIRNSQDTINFTKTAEGALSEVNKLLAEARTLAVASANVSTLSTAQLQANQQQLNSISSSITRIAQQTQFGTKKLLDGSAGNTSAVTDAMRISTVSIGGNWNGSSLAVSSAVTVASVTAGTQASVSATATFTYLTSTVATAGNFTINGVTFAASATTTAADLVNQVNSAASQTGVTAVWSSSAGLQFQSSKYGSAQSVNVTDANGVILATAGTLSASGTDASAVVTVNGTSVNFTGGQAGNDGLTLTDRDGNQIGLTTGGNQTTSTAAVVGQVYSGTTTFQIGGNVGLTSSLSIGNFSSSQLGGGAVAGMSVANLDVTSSTGAANSILVLDRAIDQISTARGEIGNFQRNILETNVRSLGIAKENLSSSESSIRDVDMAEEMSTYTKFQIIQQAGISVLGQANQSLSSVLSLLRT